jgi:hypothetical protein
MNNFLLVALILYSTVAAIGVLWIFAQMIRLRCLARRLEKESPE